MWLDLAMAMAVAALASALASCMMLQVRVLDAPTMARKMHAEPMPTCGGLGAAIGFALGLAALTAPGFRAWSADLPLVAALRSAGAAGLALVFAAIGLYDDLRPMGPRLKFALFAAAAIAAPLLIGGPDTLPFAAGAVLHLSPLMAVLGAALWVFVLVNAVNFLDGVDGLAIGSVAIGLVALALLALTSGAVHAGALALCAAGALAGLLAWNFPEARLFSGDVGALFAGALAAGLSLLAIEDGGISPFTPPALFFPFLGDALTTLVWRFTKGRRLLDGHREHMFHIALRAGQKRVRITQLYWGLTAVCALLAIAAHLAQRGAFLPMAQRGGALDAVLTAAPALLLALMTIAAINVSARVRAFAAARSLDTE
jgi:UDP-N-acetylmuramyl pentapeptide phosphotransferase/UDP-N-acetylglucosamine-1-phosphate transferase